MITADQILAHAIGDYIIQSDWMARNKTKNDWAALIHAVTYSLPFLLIIPYQSFPVVWLAIVLSHFVIDRYRLARYLCWIKNGPRQRQSNHTTLISDWWTHGEWVPITATGYPSAMPPWMSFWLLIAADNIAHVCINGLAIRFLASLP